MGLERASARLPAGVGRTRAIDLLPALPAELGTGEVSGLIARPGVVVDIRWRDGALIDATLRARRTVDWNASHPIWRSHDQAIDQGGCADARLRIRLRHGGRVAASRVSRPREPACGAGPQVGSRGLDTRRSYLASLLDHRDRILFRELTNTEIACILNFVHLARQASPAAPR